MQVIREQYTDLAPCDWVAVEAGGYDTCQAKFDGEFCNIVIRGREASVVSRDGTLRDVLRLGKSVPPCTLLAEHLSPKRPRGMLAPKVTQPTYIIFRGLDATGQLMSNDALELVASARKSFSLAHYMQGWGRDWPDLWNWLVLELGHEGLIFRNSREPFGRCARMVNPDYRPFEERQ